MTERHVPPREVRFEGPPVSDAARRTIASHAADYGTVLSQEARIIARQFGDDEVRPGHVVEAGRRLVRRRRTGARKRALAGVFGGGLFAAGLQGFLAEVTKSDPAQIGQAAVIVWAILLVAGTVISVAATLAGPED